jgi:hypothetical protein
MIINVLCIPCRLATRFAREQAFRRKRSAGGAHQPRFVPEEVAVRQDIEEAAGMAEVVRHLE